MFLRQLSSSFLPRSRPTLCRAGFRSSSASSNHPNIIPASYPCWSVPGYPPWTPQLPHSYPGAYQHFPGRTLHGHNFSNISAGYFGSSWRSFYSSTGLMMEWSDRDRGPPHKRRKSVEEKRSSEGKEGGLTEGSKREHRNIHSHQHERSKDGSRDRGKNGTGKGVSREHFKDKDPERTKTWDKDWQRKDSSSRDEAPNRGRSSHQQGGQTDSQPERSKTQTPMSKSVLDKVPTQKPNPWFKDRGAEEQGGCESNTKGPEGHLRDRSRSTFPENPWKAAESNREPPPPGICPPERQQEDVKPVKTLQRHWENSPICRTYPDPPGRSTAFDFSVMSYNILSQELLHDNSYLYQHCQPNVLPWEHRLPNLLAEIQQYDADILCLQEVQEDHYKIQIKPALQALGYHCEYKKRTGRKPDGCAVIFKASRLSLLSSNPVEYFRKGDPLLDRDNVGLVLLLRPNDITGQSDPSDSICVANTHLLYNPRRGDIKLAQLAILLAEIKRLSCRPDGSNNPVVLCGDFNSTPWSPLYNFLTTGCLDYRGMQIGMVSGQESIPRGQRLLTSPIWSPSLGIDYQCQYKSKPATESSQTSSPTAVEGAISNLTVEDLAATAAAAAYNRMWIKHDLKLQSSYQHRLMPDGRPEITTCHSRTAMTVDYILYTPEFITPPSLPGGCGLQLLSRLSLVGQSELEEVNGLPNKHHSSDHLPLLARFRIRR